jgi:hypothetical protein
VNNFNFLNQQDENRSFEEAREIEITRNTIKFGTSLYQFKNLTGLKVGKIDKKMFPFQIVLPFGIGGLFIYNLNNLFGIIFILVAIIWTVKHFMQIQQYGLILYLNSGQQRIFISDDRKFLMNIVSEIYKLMKSGGDGSISIDMSNRSINVGEGGLFSGIGITGDGNQVN